MPKPKLTISLSQISKDIVKAEALLKKLEKQAASADQKKIRLEIKVLGKFNRWIRQTCRDPRRMTQVFTAKMTSGCKK
jgi:hypothetical protein